MQLSTVLDRVVLLALGSEVLFVVVRDPVLVGSTSSGLVVLVVLLVDFSVLLHR